MLYWYVINCFEIAMGILFLAAAYKFFIKNKKIGHGILYLMISVSSFSALFMSVQMSGILTQ